MTEIKKGRNTFLTSRVTEVRINKGKKHFVKRKKEGNRER